ncbi:MAG: hypothetical protein R3E96_06700 [Planctomycetota bacterium]
MNSGQTSAAPHGALIIPRVRFELPGGAVLLVSRRPKAPVTAVRIHMKGGILTDPVGWEGLSEWVGGLLDQGTANMDEAAIADAIEPYGGSVAGDATGCGARWRGRMAPVARRDVRVGRAAAFPGRAGGGCRSSASRPIWRCRRIRACRAGAPSADWFTATIAWPCRTTARPRSWPR